VSGSVRRIATTPVKGFMLAFPERVLLTGAGVVENRRFALIDESGERLRSAKHPWPCTVAADYDEQREHLRIRFPDGAEVDGSVSPGELVRFDYHGDLVDAHVVEGPWMQPLSALARMPTHLVKLDRPGSMQGQPVTLLSSASLERFAAEAGHDVDTRRFRMLFEVDGCTAHEEDGWLGRRVRVGEAILRVVELVERCVVTTRDPATGERDLDSLGLLRGYRGSIDLGVRAEVVQPGKVVVGAAVEALD
jgi:uncharacterized protein YcbX